MTILEHFAWEMRHVVDRVGGGVRAFAFGVAFAPGGPSC